MGDKRKSEVLDARDAEVLLFSWFYPLVEAATLIGHTAIALRSSLPIKQPASSCGAQK
jgi:hypothetical protein